MTVAVGVCLNVAGVGEQRTSDNEGSSSDSAFTGVTGGALLGGGNVRTPLVTDGGGGLLRRVATGALLGPGDSDARGVNIDAL